MFRLWQFLRIKPLNHSSLPLKVLPTRLQESFDLRDSRQVVADARQPVDGINRFLDQMLWVAREHLHQSRDVDLRVARVDRRVKSQEAIRR